MALSPAAEVMILIMAANGGVMTEEDCKREFMRVISLSPEELADWWRKITPLAREHARQVLELEDE